MSARWQSLRGRQGFTLVEVIVTSAILLLLIAVTGGIILSSLGGFTRVAAMAEAKQLGLAVYDFYQDRLTEALTVSLQTAVGQDQSLAVAGGTGRVLYNGADLYGDAIYNGMKVRTSQWAEGYILHLKVEIWRDEDGDGLYDDGEAVFVKQSAFRINNLKRSGGSIGGSPGSSGSPHINGAIYYQE